MLEFPELSKRLNIIWIISDKENNCYRLEVEYSSNWCVLDVSDKIVFEGNNFYKDVSMLEDKIGEY
jgi:hypothetical protein